jgi:hypothetical protein
MKISSILLLTAATLAASLCPKPLTAQPSSNVHVWVTGLNSPRGLKFGPDGKLYVAEGGSGGTTSTTGTCTQVIGPVGPYTGGNTSQISRIDSEGTRTIIASGFPSTVDAMGDLSGVADVAFLDGTLYALEGGAGCSHGDALPNGIYSVNIKTGSWKLFANLSEFIQTHMVKYPNPPDFEPDGTFYSMVEFDNRLYAVEPNHGQIVAIKANGSMESVMDVSASQGHIVPTTITSHDGQFYLGNLNLFPIQPNYARILVLSHPDRGRVAAPGFEEPDSALSLHVLESKAGFTTVVGTAFGPDGLLYVLEFSDAAGYPTPGDGKVVRIKADGDIEDVATGLVVPTAMTFGPDGKLYVSNFGAAPPGAGQIVRVDIP